MSSRLFRRAPLALGVVGLLAVTGLTTGTASAAAPAPCNGLFATDPDGDAVTPGGITGDEGPAQANMEQTGFFFNYAPGADGKSVLTANIVVKNLDKTVPDPYLVSGGLYYYAHWLSGGESRFVKAENDGSGTITYGFGTVNEEGVYTTDGDTKGNFFEGPNGVVQIEVPEAFNGKPGDKLEKVVTAIDAIEGQDDFFGFNNHADTAGSGEEDASTTTPNGTADYTVTACPAGAPTTTDGGGGSTGGGTTGGGTTGGGSTGGGGSTTAPQPGGSTQDFTTLPFKPVKSALGSAKKAKKKGLTFKAAANADITNLSVKLAKGKKALGTGKAALFKKGTANFKLKTSKKLKKGKYTLLATGIVNGKKLSVSLPVTVKK